MRKPGYNVYKHDYLDFMQSFTLCVDSIKVTIMHKNGLIINLSFQQTNTTDLPNFLKRYIHSRSVYALIAMLIHQGVEFQIL